MAFDKGAANTFRQHNFTSFQELHKPENDSELVRPFHNTFSGLFDMTGAKKASVSTQFSWWEANRTMPLVKATNSAGGGAGVAVVFTIDATARTSFGSYNPYNTGTTATTAAVPVRKYDVIQLPPASGLASAGSYMSIIVTAVTATTFTAEPLDSTDTIPANASAVEMIIIGNAHGEGSGLQAPLSTTTTKYTENLQIVKHRYQVTGTEKLQALWVNELNNGRGGNLLPAEKDAYIQFLKFQDLTLLVGEKMSNVGLSDDFIDGTLETNAPIKTSNGTITQVLAGGQILNYSTLTGVTLADIRDYNTTIDKDGAEKENILHLGIDIDQDLDREIGDRVVNGGITYGMFNFDQEKAINLQFTKLKVGSYTYNKRCMEALNDRQSLGAEGYGYSYEALMLPMGESKKLGYDDEAGKKVATVRKRFLANYGASRESMIEYYDGFKQSDNGTDKDEVRYQCEIGVEIQARNKTGYWKRG